MCCIIILNIVLFCIVIICIVLYCSIVLYCIVVLYCKVLPTRLKAKWAGEGEGEDKKVSVTSAAASRPPWPCVTSYQLFRHLTTTTFPPPQFPDLRSVTRERERKMSLQVKIGFVGAGAMAQAIAEGLLTSGTLSPDNILASATSSRFRAWWEQRNVKFSEDNHAVIQVRTQ